MNAKLIEKMKYFVGIDDEGYEEDFEDGGVEDSPEPNKGSNSRRDNVKNKKVRNLYQHENLNVVIYEPKDFEEASIIVDNLKENKPVIVNLEDIEVDAAKKFFDFLSGAVYAIDGSIQKVSNSIFILAPSNVDLTEISGQNRGKNKSDFPWQK